MKVGFYLCDGGRCLCRRLCVTPVRRREDTDGDGDSGVKVQIAGVEVSLLSGYLAAVESKRLDWEEKKKKSRCTLNGATSGLWDGRMWKRRRRKSRAQTETNAI